MQLLATRLGLGAGKRVLDLAAGTGKLTRALTGLEPRWSPSSRSPGCARSSCSLPGCPTLGGTAERIPLDDGTLDGVVVAQAFHWFDAAAAAAESTGCWCPTERLAVIWNSWDESVPWVERTQEIIHRHVKGAQQQRTSSIGSSRSGGGSVR